MYAMFEWLGKSCTCDYCDCLGCDCSNNTFTSSKVSS